MHLPQSIESFLLEHDGCKDWAYTRLATYRIKEWCCNRSGDFSAVMYEWTGTDMHHEAVEEMFISPEQYLTKLDDWMKQGA